MTFNAGHEPARPSHHASTIAGSKSAQSVARCAKQTGEPVPPDDAPYKGRMSEVVYSPLSRSVEHEGREFQIEIYQADRPSSWLLEILDDEGASTVWDDVFEDEQEALEEAPSRRSTRGSVGKGTSEALPSWSSSRR